MEMRLLRLTEIDPSDIIELMNDPLVRRHMPLSMEVFGAAECAGFVSAKEALWRDHGYGPWAFVVDGEFAGWGGLQPEGADADLGIVLHQRFWGLGRAIAEHFLDEAFGTHGFGSVIVLLPASRAAAHGALRLGFVPDGETEFSGIPFHRFRFPASSWAGPRRVEWTDDLTVGLPAGRSVAEVVEFVLRASRPGVAAEDLEQLLMAELGLSLEDASLAVERTHGGLIRAWTGNEDNCPSREKDPVAWESFQRGIRDPSLVARVYPGLGGR